ncbi:SAP domain [Popillia japonica]|uniref:SAP domain n=1 Tax=Popillia japonica TaxID=7064 RepID=A0AAW1H3Y8_POPJA
MDNKTKISTLKKDELKSILEKRGLNKNGQKIVLVNRLKEAFNSSYILEEDEIKDAMNDSNVSMETVVNSGNLINKTRNERFECLYGNCGKLW